MKETGFISLIQKWGKKIFLAYIGQDFTEKISHSLIRGVKSYLKLIFK